MLAVEPRYHAGMLSSLLVVTGGLLGSAGALPAERPTAESSRQPDIATVRAALNEDSIDAWRDHIRAQPSELRWMEIPWQSTFAQGMIAASDAGKPMLFWAMNGHPMGCT